MILKHYVLFKEELFTKWLDITQSIDKRTFKALFYLQIHKYLLFFLLILQSTPTNHLILKRR